MSSLKVTKKYQDQRLDLFLVEKLKTSRKKAKQMIDEGQVFIGPRKIIIASWKLQEGDEVELKDPKSASLPRRERYLKVLYEDLDILVVEKPPGVACERTAQTLTSTLVDDINDYLKRAHPNRPYPYVGLMHRLDRETSGLMIYTLSRRANRLSEQFKGHRVVRRYLALVQGRMQKTEGRINLALRKDPKFQGKRMQVFRTKKGVTRGRALTQYEVIKLSKNHSLLRVGIAKGSRHQIRIHLASLGHPVVGDKIYGKDTGGEKFSYRHLLHATAVNFKHPFLKNQIQITSPLPKDFKP